MKIEKTSISDSMSCVLIQHYLKSCSKWLFAKNDYQGVLST